MGNEQLKSRQIVPFPIGCVHQLREHLGRSVTRPCPLHGSIKYQSKGGQTVDRCRRDASRFEQAKQRIERHALGYPGNRTNTLLSAFPLSATPFTQSPPPTLLHGRAKRDLMRSVWGGKEVTTCTLSAKRDRGQVDRAGSDAHRIGGGAIEGRN